MNFATSSRLAFLTYSLCGLALVIAQPGAAAVAVHQREQRAHQQVHETNATSTSRTERILQQQVSPCPFHPEVEGYQDIASLQEDINSGVTGQDFVLCPGITYVKRLVLIATTASPAPLLVVRCAEVKNLTETGPCYWEAAAADERHMFLYNPDGMEAALSVQVKGIQFASATESSILVDASAAATTMMLHFENCTWQANFGDAVVEISNATTTLSSPGDDLSLAQVTIKKCTFEDNSVSESILYTANARSAKLIVDQCDFLDNNGAQSMIVLQDGAHGTMSNIQFINNTVTTPGLIFVEGTARINETDTVCGIDNEVIGVSENLCNGTVLDVANIDNCINTGDLACAPACSSYRVCPVDEEEVEDCIPTKDELFAALDTAVSGDTIILCSETTILLERVDPPFEIGGALSSITFVCENIDCHIQGGNEQFHIVDGATEVIFEGITFMASQQSSIEIDIDPTEPASIIFKDCHWRNHNGGAYLISAAYSLQADLQQGEQRDPIEAVVRITRCHFKNNNVEQYLVQNRALDVSLHDSTFETSVGRGMVGALGGSTLVRSTSLQTNEVSRALFFVGLNSEDLEIEEICGADNKAGSCNGTFYEASDPAQCREESSNAAACEQRCVPLRTACQPSCYTKWADLNSAIELASEGRAFEICANTRMELSDRDNAIEISVPGTVVRCGIGGSRLDDCTIAGGSNHFVVNTTSAIFLGLAFSGATTTSVRVFADLATDPAILFDQCHWSDNNGTNTFEILRSSDFSSGDARRELQDGQKRSLVDIFDSIFVNNTATGNIISNNGADLALTDTNFNSNKVGKSVLSTENNAAINNMVDVQFQGNLVQLGVVFIGFGASLNQIRVCGSENVVEEIPCEGVFRESTDSADCENGDLDACRAACTSLDSCTNGTGVCYSEWSTLTDAVEASQGSDTFVVCPNSEFNLLDENSLLQIREDNTILRCGVNGERHNRCVLFGGEEQLRINGTGTGIRIEGITFIGSSYISVAAVGEGEASATFYECEFSGHQGQAVILVASTDVVAESQQLSEGMVPSSRSMEVNIESCQFDDNIVDLASISSLQGVVSITQTTFNGNSGLGAAGAISSLYDASLSVSESCFVGNAGNFSGVILLSLESSSNFNQDDNFGDSNQVAFGNCTEILTFDESLTCTGFQSSICLVESPSSTPTSMLTLAPTLAPLECIDDWGSLRQAVRDSFVPGDENVFILCRNVTMQAEGDPILLDQNDGEILFQCGRTGLFQNNCTISGGDRQFRIFAEGIEVTFKGVGFESTTDLSILAGADKTSVVRFDRCRWVGHTGESAVLIYGEAIGREYDAQVPIGNLPVPDSSMTALFEDCIFKDNPVSFAAVSNVGGTTTFTLTVFESNVQASAASIMARIEAKVELTDCCFIENESLLPGAVLLTGLSELAVNEDNYGFDNQVGITNCTAVFTLGFNEDCVVDSCPGTCLSFESQACRIPGYEYHSPSAAPSVGATFPTVSSSPSTEGGILPPTQTPTSLGACYDDDSWGNFFVALRDSEGDEIFTLCPNVTVNMTDMEANGLAPLMIQAPDITIRCGSRRRGSCVLSGGSKHMVLRSNLETLKIRYITMEKATEVSVIGTPVMPFSIEFENCDWRNSSGAATVQIDAIDPLNPLPGNDDIVGGRALLEDNDNYLICDRCMFEQNTASNAIIAVSDTTLVLDATDFRANIANVSLISVGRGSVVLRDSCVVDSSSAALFEANDSEVTTQDVFLSGNSGSNCPGYIDTDGKCVEAEQTDSCVAAEKRCYAHWDDLSLVLEQAPNTDEELIFTICENTVLDVAISAPIEISRSKTTIRCGLNGARDSSCLVRGGGVQFQIVGSPTDVLFSGLTFAGASVAAIYAGGERRARAQVTDCIFRNMDRGQAAILIYSGNAVPSPNRNGRRLAIEDFTEPSDRSMTMEISYSTFTANTVELGPIANLKGTIIVTSCVFNQNEGSAGGVGEWFGGSMVLSSSCFSGNTGVLAGSVYVDGDSTTESNNYSDNNEAADGDCLDLFLAKATASEGASEGLCVDFSSVDCQAQDAPTASPTIAPTLPGVPTAENFPTRAPLPCISTWSGLREAIVDEFTQGIENVFTLCPDVAMQAGSDPILLDQNDGDILFECGRNGRLRDNCTISGGVRQFHIFATGIEVAFRGIGFESSTELSVLAGADKASSVRFDKCQWVGHGGLSAVLIYSESAGQEYDGQTAIEDLPLSDASMIALFDDCFFKDNPVTYAAISNVGGTAKLTLTAFENQMEASAATIVATSEAILEVRDCCFIENDSELPGAILLTERSEILVNENNYGFDNRVGITTCTDIFTLAPEESCISASCPGTCSTFDKRTCSIPGYEYEVPSSAPSGTPLGGNDDFSGPTNLRNFDVDETSLFGSGYFVRNLVVGAIVAILGFVAFFYCKTKQGKSEKKENTPDGATESAPAPTSEDIAQFQDEGDIIMPADGVILDPGQIPKTETKKEKGSLFGWGKKKEVPEKQEELEPMVLDAQVGPLQDFDDSSGRFSDEGDEKNSTYLLGNCGVSIVDDGRVQVLN